MMFLWITRDGEVGLSLSMPHSKYNWIKNKVFGDELIMAAKNDDLSTVEGALKFGVDPNTKELDEYRWTALLWACENGYSEIVDCLLEHGADVDAEDTSNWTTLILASRNGFLDIVRVLLDKNAGVNKKTNLHWTSLMWTARQGHVEVAKLLLERGADYTVQDKATFSPLIQASQDGHLGIVKVLVEYDSSPDHLDQRTTNDWTALMTSIKNEHEDISEFLMEKGCDVHNATKDGVTALHVASYRGLNNTVKNLCLRKKVKVDEQDEDGVTPLIFAAEQGNLDIVKTLVESGHADVNLPESENEWTAIFFAMESGHQNVLEYLLSSGRVNLKHEDTSEKTIVDLAKEINHTAFQYMLQCHTQETEAILSRRIREEAKPVDMNNYKSMLNRMEYKLAAKPGKEVSAGAA